MYMEVKNNCAHNIHSEVIVEQTGNGPQSSGAEKDKLSTPGSLAGSTVPHFK